MGSRIEGPVLLFGCEILTLGGIEGLAFLHFSFLLQLAQLGYIFFVAAVQTAFLHLQIAELLFVFEKRFEIDQGGAHGALMLGEQFDEFDAAARLILFDVAAAEQSIVMS